MLHSPDKFSPSMDSPAMRGCKTHSPPPLSIRFSLHNPLRSLHDQLFLSSPPLRPPRKLRPPSKTSPSAACLHIHSTAPRTDTPPATPATKFPGFRRNPGSTNPPTAKVDEVWLKIRDEAVTCASQEPVLARYYKDSILSYDSLEFALANHLSVKLAIPSIPSTALFDVFYGVFVEDRDAMDAVREDLRAAVERDPACVGFAHCFLNYKGFLAIQSHRVAHRLWIHGRQTLALVIQNRVSEIFAVDIHPGAKIGRGILLDHATGVVVGETAVIGNNVSILHNVTLGGTGKDSGDRHPKIGNGVLIGAETCILGSITIGEGAKIGAGSVVLRDVPPRTTAVGNPARLVGGKENPVRLDKMPGLTMDHTSHISEWSDYVI